MLATAAKQIFTRLGGIKEADLDFNAAKLASIAPHFADVEAKTGVPKYLLAAMAWTESGFDANAKNRWTNAAGLMQLMPGNWSYYGISKNPYDPAGNIMAGAKDLLAKGYGKKPLYDVIAGYNGFRSRTDPVKLAEFETYYKRIGARWAYLATTGALNTNA